MPEISVIIPAYNAEKTIKKTINSVLSQTFRDFELIVVDDGSTDNTIAIVDEFSDRRIRVFSFCNSGPSIARNHGIVNSIGQYIAFIDADDLWTPDKLEKQLSSIKKSDGYGVSYSWTYNMYDEGERLEKAEKVFFSGDVLEDLLKYYFLVSGSNPLVRKSAIDDVGMFDPRLSLAEDWEFCLRLASRWEFTVVQEYQIFYRKSHSTISSDVAMFEKKMGEAIEIIYNNVPMSLQARKLDSLANLYLYLAEKSLEFPRELEQLQVSFKYLFKTVRLKPRFIFTKRFGQHVKRIIKFPFKLILPWNL